MSAAKRFAQRITEMNGVAHFVLTRNDGLVIVHNLADPDDLATSVTLAGTNALAIRKTIGFSQLRYLLFPQAQGEHLLVFSLDKYFLGVQLHHDCDHAALIDEISGYLQTLLSQGRPD
jgi:predicted regulator of Ras-like GTPase activity (Roadblock/LC7/MglB family)